MEESTRTKGDLIGKRFNKWVVIENAGECSKNYRRFLCRCDCGVIELVSERTLLRPISYGCLTCRSKATGFGKFNRITYKERFGS